MPFIKKCSLLLCALVVAFSSAAYAGVDRDKDKDKDKSKEAQNRSQVASKGAAACDLGSAQADLSINNVQARVYNNGGLFWIGGNPIYEVPKGSGVNAIFASGIWLGGLAGGSDLRMAAATYSDWEFWPGPLDENGNPPADCEEFDRIYSVTREDIQAFQNEGTQTADIADWPADLGAPFVDTDNDGIYSPGAGDYPELIGDQTLWWVMNDAANTHNTTETPAIGLEVQVTAFAFNQAGALGNTTFYKYKMIYKGDEPLTDFYFGLWSDPDLGDAGDDYVGSDSTLGLGFVYNGDNFDGGGYGDQPPALGYDFFQGPRVDDDGIDNDGDGDIDEGADGVDNDGDGLVDEEDEFERIGMQKFVYYNNDSSVQGNPGAASEYYGYLKGEWRDGTPITFGGTGLGFSNDPASFMFPAKPGEFWSEDNIDGRGTSNTPSDRRFLQSSGPFTLQPGAEQEIVFGIVWSQGGTRQASVALLKQDDIVAQGAFNLNFDIPRPPDAPRVDVVELDDSVVLSWGYEPTDNNYLNSYEAPSPFLVDENAADQTLNFEGYIVYEFTSPQDQEGEVVAVLDRSNGVANIIGNVVDPATGEVVTAVLVPGSDTGVQQSIVLNNSVYSSETGLRNYTEYYYGVQAYAYNAFSEPAIYRSPITRVTAVPSRVTARDGGTLVNAEVDAVLTSVRTSGDGGGEVLAKIVDPTAITGGSYEARFYDVDNEADGEEEDINADTYTLVRINPDGTEDVLYDGGAYFEETGTLLPLGSDVFVEDGLSFTLQGPAGGPLVIDGSDMFVEWVAPGGGDPCPPGDTSFGCAEVGGDLVHVSFNSTSEYFLYHLGPAGSEGSVGNYAPRDYEIRFGESSYAYHPFTTGNAMEVPFTVWDIGIVGPNNENDPSDDVQLIPNMFSDNGGECEFNVDESEGDPFGVGFNGTDRIYAYYPTTSYADWEAAVEPLITADPNGCPNAYDATGGEIEAQIDFGRGRPLQREVIFSGYTSAEQLAGTVIRYYTTKPILPGDVYEVDTEEVAAVSGDVATAEEALDLIGIVPNPYKGASSYEVSRVLDVVRFTNLPEQATIRIFTLNGTLIRTLEKSGPETYLNWDLNTSENLPIASGMYLVHVEVPGVGERVLKFAAVKKRVQLNEL